MTGSLSIRWNGWILTGLAVLAAFSGILIVQIFLWALAFVLSQVVLLWNRDPLYEPVRMFIVSRRRNLHSAIKLLLLLLGWASLPVLIFTAVAHLSFDISLLVSIATAALLAGLNMDYQDAREGPEELRRVVKFGRVNKALFDEMSQLRSENNRLRQALAARDE